MIDRVARPNKGGWGVKYVRGPSTTSGPKLKYNSAGNFALLRMFVLQDGS